MSYLDLLPKKKSIDYYIMTFKTYNIPVCLSTAISKKGSRELIFDISPFEKQP